MYHGFSSIEAWIKNPGLVPYTPRSMTTAQLAAAIDSRWVHCANAQIPWSGLKAYSVRLGQTVCVTEMKKTFPENTDVAVGPSTRTKIYTHSAEVPQKHPQSTVVPRIMLGDYPSHCFAVSHRLKKHVFEQLQVHARLAPDGDNDSRL